MVEEQVEQVQVVQEVHEVCVGWVPRRCVGVYLLVDVG